MTPKSLDKSQTLSGVERIKRGRSVKDQVELGIWVGTGSALGWHTGSGTEGYKPATQGHASQVCGPT